MDLEMLKGRLKTALVLGGALYGAGYGFSRWQMRQVETQLEAEREQAAQPPPERFPGEREGLAAAREKRWTQALAAARAGVSSAEPEQSAAARAQLRHWLVESAREAGAAREWEKAQSHLGEAEGIAVADASGWSPESDLRRGWLKQALSAKDAALAERLAKPLLARPLARSDIAGIELLGAYALFLLELSESARAAGAAAESDARLEQAAAAAPDLDGLSRRLRGEAGRALAERARAASAAGRAASALALWQAALNSELEPKPDARECRAALSRSHFALGLVAESAGRRLDVIGSADHHFERIPRGDPLWPQARRRLFELNRAEAEAAEREGAFDRAEPLYERAIAILEQDALERIQAGEPPGAALEPGFAGALAKAPKGSAARLELANSLRRADPSPLLDAAEIQKRRPILWARRGLASLGYPEKGFRLIRSALRAGLPPEENVRVEQGLREAVRRARDAQDFSSLVDFAAFYLSELGVPAPSDPLHHELIGALEAAAAKLGESQKNKRVFLLTVLAEAFPGSPQGRQAATEAVAKGIELFETVSNRGPDQLAERPSGLDGLSVIAIENATEHHILIFYDGPEKFFVRVNPYRRGSALMKDGAYKVGVMATSDQIVPYVADARYKGGWDRARYVIEVRGGNAERDPVGWRPPAVGDYEMLRAPADARAVSVDPKTGAAGRSGRSQY